MWSTLRLIDRTRASARIGVARVGRQCDFPASGAASGIYGEFAQARTATILSIQERQRDYEARKGVRGCDRRTGRRPTDSGADA